jgi:hypothetical protein
LFHFHKNELGHVRAKVAPPRLNGIRTGVFSTRSPHRPCPIGLSLVKIIKIEDYTIYFEGVDMIDQTPVLDIKPYIPQYDNPSHFEKILHSNHLDGWVPNDIDETLSANCNDNMSVLNQKSVIYSKNIKENQSLIHVSSSSSSSTSSLIDVSRDEELALRLQAEEFQENLNFENVYVSNETSNILEDNNVTSTITNINPVSYNATNLENNENEGQNFRNSRLLDGADGPNAICGTDLDLISRRALNLRLDDSSSLIVILIHLIIILMHLIVMLIHLIIQLIVTKQMQALKQLHRQAIMIQMLLECLIGYRDRKRQLYQ